MSYYLRNHGGNMSKFNHREIPTQASYNVQMVMDSLGLTITQLAKVLKRVEPKRVKVTDDDIYNYIKNRCDAPAEKYLKIVSLLDTDTFNQHSKFIIELRKL